MIWRPRAEQLAAAVTHPHSRWRTAVAAVPRHVFIPQWWTREEHGWSLHDGPADPDHWLNAAYADRSLITAVAGHHADGADPDHHPTGRPTSSATLPSLLIQMYRHARIGPNDSVLDVGTGSGYGTALLAQRLGDARVTSIDVDKYLVEAARERLSSLGRYPLVETADATGAIPGVYDRIVATVGMPHIPASWLAALRPGGRLVTTLAGTSLIITADKHAAGHAAGRVEWDRAGFMAARSGRDYPADATDQLTAAWTTHGDVKISPYPVVDVEQAWDLSSMVALTIPGVEHGYRVEHGRRIAVMAHPDGSWARATSTGPQPASVHQGGPRRLWDQLDAIREQWLTTGELPVRGARVRIEPTGRTVLTRSGWHTVVRP
ncbi:methyltransferase domain-containing protein [Streptomyces harbinensis]|uniref:methyltransferase domain-containing protein n=1 Tax=Streptomyces harbinensis TaxID=1176198 RepID=UPI0034DECF48